MKKPPDKPWREIIPEYPPIFEFEKKGDKICGVLEEVKHSTGPHGSEVYVINVGGERMSVWGSVAMDERMKVVPVGCEVRITYQGKEKNPKTNRSYKVFTVEVAE